MLRELISGSVTFRPLGELFMLRSQATVRLVVVVVAAIGSTMARRPGRGRPRRFRVM